MAQSGADSSSGPYFVPEHETLDTDGLRALQGRRLADLLGEVREKNPFYRRKLQNVQFNPLSDSMEHLPFTTRDELEADQIASPPYGTNLTYPLDQYTRY